VCREIPAPQLANLVEDGATPWLPPARLEALGYKVAAYPLTLLSSAIRAMQDALARLAAGEPVPRDRRLAFAELQALVGFPEYDAEARRYALEE
jgi:2-methylisocitrate lyase-like PEP mutase family enzyme